MGQFSAYPGLLGKLGGRIASFGPESYQSFGRDNALQMELFRDGEARAVMSEFYDWYSPSPEHSERGYYQHLVHGGCFFTFSLSQFFAYPNNYAMWSWDGRRWGNRPCVPPRRLQQA